MQESMTVAVLFIYERAMNLENFMIQDMKQTNNFQIRNIQHQLYVHFLVDKNHHGPLMVYLKNC